MAVQSDVGLDFTHNLDVERHATVNGNPELYLINDEEGDDPDVQLSVWIAGTHVTRPRHSEY